MFVKTPLGRNYGLFHIFPMCDKQAALLPKSHLTFCKSLRIATQRISALFVLLAAFNCLCALPAQGEEKDTFSISLVQQATVKKMDEKEIVYERYKVKKGDYIWKILRQKGLLKKPDIKELVSALKNMNKSLKNFDLIHPGETILIPLNIMPIKGYKEEDLSQESIMGVSSLKDITFENYVVRSGDSLTMIVHGKHKVPPKYLYNEYLSLVKKFNPTLKNLDLIYPNQVIRLPIFSPKIVRLPIEHADKKPALGKNEVALSKDTPYTASLRRKLKDIFDQIGEEWIDTGEQFIPLKSGGQVNLKAESFPVLNLQSGIRLIVDIKNELPEDVSRLIKSDWEDYGIVHLAADDTLETALDKILAQSNYYKILKSGETFDAMATGDIALFIAGDRVIIPHGSDNAMPDKIVVINFIDQSTDKTPKMIRTYLQRLGITVIDYSETSILEDMDSGSVGHKKIDIDKDRDFPLPAGLLKLAGQPFSDQVKIPVYQGEGSGFNLIIKADLFFNRKGKDCVIDLTGLSPAVVSLLKKHQFNVLSLAGETNTNKVIELILDFLGLPFESEAHDFLVSARDKTKNILLKIPGIIFNDHEANKIFATDREIPEEIISFLDQREYAFFDLTQFKD
jgi:LysM repeat protein